MNSFFLFTREIFFIPNTDTSEVSLDTEEVSVLLYVLLWVSISTGETCSFRLVRPVDFDMAELTFDLNTLCRQSNDS